MRRGNLYLLGLVVAFLVGLGLLVLFSAGGANGARIYHDPYHFIKNQCKFVACGLPILLIVAAFDYRKWREHWILPVLFFAVVFSLLWAVFLFEAKNGSFRWIKIPGSTLRLQPSEFAKLAVVIIVSVFLDKAGWRVELFKRGVVMPMMVIALLLCPVLLEPDYGSSMVIASAGLLIMIIAGVKWLHIFMLIGAGLAVGAPLVIKNANRMARIAAFFGIRLENFFPDLQVSNTATKAAAYQAEMARVAIQRGGIFGVGYGESMQKQLYLPEAHTDFIFAIGAEELGVGFSIFVIFLFVAFFAICINIARQTQDRFGRFLVVGMSFLIFFQAMFNLGVVCEALPTKGMALPFFSYGGTNMMSSCFAVGTIFSVAIRSCNASRRRIAARGK